jgi:pyruvate/2-oxoglutarate dehydrogenase complex dihydrolipoamide dehydrogenase (E3) component
MHHDVIILGTGQAGVPLAVRLAGAGRRGRAVRLREGHQGGGILVGCWGPKSLK